MCLPFALQEENEEIPGHKSYRLVLAMCCFDLQEICSNNLGEKELAE